MLNQSILNLPTKLENSSSQCSVRYWRARQNVDLPDGQHLSLIKDVPIAASIILLNQLSRPAAIIWCVVQVWVYAIQRMFIGRARPHVPKEYRKVFPFFANRDSSSSVEVKIRIVGVGASSKHSRPSHIIRRMTCSMSCKPFRSGFGAEASAGLRISRPQMAGFGHMQVAAIAAAFPIRVYSSQNKKASESFIGKINKTLWHLFDVASIGHKVKSGGLN